jgi:hypothetical protein
MVSTKKNTSILHQCHPDVSQLSGMHYIDYVEFPNLQEIFWSEPQTKYWKQVSESKRFVSFFLHNGETSVFQKTPQYNGAQFSNCTWV